MSREKENLDQKIDKPMEKASKWDFSKKLSTSNKPSSKEYVIIGIIFSVAWIYGIIAHALNFQGTRTIDWDVFWSVNHHIGSPYDIYGYYWLPYGHYLYYPFDLINKFYGWFSFSIIIIICGILAFKLLYSESGLIAWGWIIVAWIPMLFDIYFGNMNIILTLLLVIAYKLAKKGNLIGTLLFPAIFASTLFKINMILAAPLLLGLLFFPDRKIISNILNLGHKKKDGIIEEKKNIAKEKNLAKSKISLFSPLNIKMRVIIGILTFFCAMIIMNVQFLIHTAWIKEFLKNFRETPQILTNGVTGSIWIYFLLEYYQYVYYFVIGALYILEFAEKDLHKILTLYVIAFAIWLITVLVTRFFIYNPLNLSF